MYVIFLLLSLIEFVSFLILVKIFKRLVNMASTRSARVKFKFVSSLDLFWLRCNK